MADIDECFDREVFVNLWPVNPVSCWRYLEVFPLWLAWLASLADNCLAYQTPFPATPAVSHRPVALRPRDHGIARGGWQNLGWQFSTESPRGFSTRR